MNHRKPFEFSFIYTQVLKHFLCLQVFETGAVWSFRSFDAMKKLLVRLIRKTCTRRDFKTRTPHVINSISGIHSEQSRELYHFKWPWKARQTLDGHECGARKDPMVTTNEFLWKCSRCALINTNGETPMYFRFFTVLENAGSVDTTRDIYGFVVNFYTKEGNRFTVANDIPSPCSRMP